MATGPRLPVNKGLLGSGSWGRVPRWVVLSGMLRPLGGCGPFFPKCKSGNPRGVFPTFPPAGLERPRLTHFFGRSLSFLFFPRCPAPIFFLPPGVFLPMGFLRGGLSFGVEFGAPRKARISFPFPFLSISFSPPYGGGPLA